jgi:hypothetical protein
LNVIVGAPAPAAVSTLNAHLPVTSTYACAAPRGADSTHTSAAIAPAAAIRPCFFVIGVLLRRIRQEPAYLFTSGSAFFQ